MIDWTIKFMLYALLCLQLNKNIILIHDGLPTKVNVYDNKVYYI